MSDNTRASRISSYKNAGQGTTELRRKRAELSVALRKQARDEQLLKRRALSPEDGDEVQVAQETLPTPEEILEGLKSRDVNVLTSSARAARRTLSREQNPPITVMVEAGVIRPLVEALDRDDCTDLQFEAAWALTNIASGSHEHTRAVVDGGAIPKLVQLLSRGGSVGEQSAWALGNIAGDGAELRDAVLAQRTLPALLPSLLPSQPKTRLGTAVWAYSNLCRNKNPLVNFDLVSPALPYISEILTMEDSDILADACWAVSYLTDGPNERIEAVQATPGLLPRVLALLSHKTVAVRTPALRATGNMLTGSDVQTDRCVEAGVLDHISALLQCNKPTLVKEAAWALSNVLAGTHMQIQRSLDHGVAPLLTKVLQHPDVKCQKEAAWAVTNLFLGGLPSQLGAVVSVELLTAYCALLASAEHRAVAVVLDGLTALLQTCESLGEVEPICLKLEEIGALDKIEALQHHENESIYKKVVNIMDKYFSEQEEAAVQPEQSNGEYRFAPTTADNIKF